MAELHEVLHRQAHADAVIDVDDRDRACALALPDADQRCRVADQVGQQPGLIAQVAQQDGAIAMAHLEHLAQSDRFGGAAANVTQHDVVAAVAGNGRDGRNSHAEERVADVADDQTEQAGARAAQSTGERIGAVARVGDDLEDAGACVVGDWHD